MEMPFGFALAVATLGASVWACTAADGRSTAQVDALGEAPPPPALRESDAAAGPSVGASSRVAPPPAEPPALLSQTGLYLSPAADSGSAAVAAGTITGDTAAATGSDVAAAGSLELHPDVLSFAPQYPLWSDGATKRRFVRLPAGGTIDASKPDVWVFPIGTRFWKEFSFSRANRQRPVETRYIERRADGSWLFASYVWDEDGHEARLAPAAGQLGVAPLPNGAASLLHDVPSRADCVTCHEGAGARAPILGFSALQLAPDRDPLAPHAEVLPGDAVDLEELRARGLLVSMPAGAPGTTEGSARPGIQADSPGARASLGYLHANCAGCHNRYGALADLGLDFEQTGQPGDAERVLASLTEVPSRFRLSGEEHSSRLVPGAPAASVLTFRMGSRSIVQQMPPLGSKVVDQEATQLVAKWIASMKQEAPTGARKETP